MNFQRTLSLLLVSLPLASVLPDTAPRTRRRSTRASSIPPAPRRRKPIASACSPSCEAMRRGATTSRSREARSTCPSSVATTGP